jgi:hypothetical protein
MSYALCFWRPTKTQFRIMNQILATPLRRALGLHRSASAVRTLWEFGIPDMETIRLRCFLQSVSRAVRSSYSGNFLPSILATDISQHQPVASPHYCRSLTQEFSEINQQYPYTSRLPLNKKVIDNTTVDAMTKQWIRDSTPKARSIKPSPDIPRYLYTDSKPTVCIRARLRLSCALTPRRKFIYGLTTSDTCCGETGDAAHVILRCKRFDSARATCTQHLLDLYVSVHLTLDLALGLPPPLPSDRSLHREKTFLQNHHDNCLRITGTFLRSIDSTSRL